MNFCIAKYALVHLVLCSSVFCNDSCNQTVGNITSSEQIVKRPSVRGRDSVYLSVQCKLQNIEGMQVKWCYKNEVIGPYGGEDWKIMKGLDLKLNDFDKDGKSLIKCMAFSADTKLMEIHETTLQLEGSKQNSCGPTNFTQHPKDVFANVGDDVSFTCLVKLGIKASSAVKNNSEMDPCGEENNLQVFWTTAKRPKILLCESKHQERSTFRKIKLVDAEGCAWVKLVMQIKNLQGADFNSADFRCQVQDMGSLDGNVLSNIAHLMQGA